MSLSLCQRIRVRQPRATLAPCQRRTLLRDRWRPQSSSRSKVLSLILEFMLLFYAPKRSPSLLHSEDAMSFTALFVSVVIAVGLILGAIVLVFVGVATMAGEARDEWH
jgi:hypothetical protein